MAVPSSSPAPAPRPKPRATRRRLIRVWSSSSPLRSMSANVPSTTSGAGRIWGGSQPNRAVAAQSTSAASGTTTARPSLASVRPGKAVRCRTRAEAISGRGRLAARIEARPEVPEAQLLQRRVQVAGLEPAGRVDLAPDEAVLLGHPRLLLVLGQHEVVEERRVAVQERLALEIGTEARGRDAGLGPELEQRLAVLLERGPVGGLDERLDAAAGHFRVLGLERLGDVDVRVALEGRVVALGRVDDLGQPLRLEV